MSSFGKFQAWNIGIQTAVLIATLLCGIIIGFRQTNISSAQTDISKRLLELEYEISILVSYDVSAKRFILSNTGRHNIYLGGAQCDPIGRPIFEQPKLIAAGQRQFIDADLTQGVPARGSFEQGVEFFLLDSQRTKFAIRGNAVTDNTTGQTVVHIRLGLPVYENW